MKDRVMYYLKKNIGKIISHLALLISAFIVFMPILFAIAISFQPPSQVFQYPPSLIPRSFYYQNYITAWQTVNLGRLLINSLIASTIVMLGKLTAGVTSGYAFSHFKFRGKTFFFFLILATLMMPEQVRIVPLFEMISNFGWANKFSGLTIPFLASATGTFLMRQHFLTIPKDLMDSARIDGCGPLRFLIQILIPLSGPTLAGLATINFLVLWNAYLWPLIIINSKNMKTAQLGVKMLMDSRSANDWGVIMAGTIIIVLPTILMFVIAQRFFVKGIANQGLKE